MKFKTVLEIFGCLAIVLTLLPFIAVDYWWVRMFDFPHLQLTLLTMAAIMAFFIKFSIRDRSDLVFITLLISCFAYQVWKILPYTRLDSYEMLNSSSDSSSPIVSFYAANVYQKNKEKDKLKAAIKSGSADILLFTETNDKWKNAIDQAVGDRYPYRIGRALPNTYGMLLYSKLPLVNSEVKTIVHDSIPSIHSLFLLPEGDTLQLFAIHPTPPMPTHNPKSTDRDAEMMKIALDALESAYPVVVLGDFNDVAWSQTTENFQEVSRLLDPRKGRGLYNTYHAEHPWFRWPLDHVFVSAHFRLASMKREEPIGSDHFPISISLSFEPEKAKAHEKPWPSQNQKELAKKQIRKENEANH